MADFSDIPEIEKFLQLTISDADQIASAERALAEATAAIRIYTRQYIEYVASETITIDSRGLFRIYLPEIPVISILEVIEEGSILTADDDYKLGAKGILHRIGRRWVKGIQNVSITYEHGFAEIPQMIKDICTRAASRAFQAGLKASSLAGVPGVTSKSLGDYAVSFADSANEGVLGASGSNLLLRSEEKLLDWFRINGAL